MYVSESEAAETLPPRVLTPTGSSPTFRFWSAIVLALLGGYLFIEGVGDGAFDDPEPASLLVSVVLQFAAAYNLIVGAVTRGIADSRADFR